MAITAFTETSRFGGVWGGSLSVSSQHVFGSPSSVWSRPYLQHFENNVKVPASWSFVDLYVSQYVDAKGAHDGEFRPGVVATGCKSVTFLMKLYNVPQCWAGLTTEFFV